MVAILASRPISVLLCAAVATALLCVVSGGGSSYKNFFADGEDIDFYVWADVHENPFYDNGVMFSGEPVYRSETKFSWSGTIDAKGVNITLPYSVRSNTSAMFAHIFVTKKGVDPNLYSQQGQVTHEHTLSVLFRTVKLTRLLPEIPIVKKRFLLKEPFLPVEKPLPESERPIVPYWAPRLAVHLVYDTNTYPAMTNDYVSQFLLYALTQMESIDQQLGVYLPIVHADELGTLTKDMLPVNKTQESKVLPLDISLGFLGTTRYEWMLKMENSVQMHKDMGTPDSEMEEVRRMFAETDSRLLVVTVVVSIVHLLFDVLAFGHDIRFWRGLKSTKGVSVRTIGIGLVMEVIVFLYLWDSGTSVLVLFTVGGSVLVNLWKLRHARTLHRTTTVKAASPQDEGEMDEEEMSSEFDAIASRYMVLLLGPPIVGYAAFSLMYMQQKSWQSWMLESAVSVVYAVGFMQMTPQLFLNYKYKSVDHLPWNALIYKAMNTFIDDLFAFVIKMPGLHRLSVFRDDVVFFIYLYQRYIYTKRRPAPGAAKSKAKDKELRAK